MNMYFTKPFETVDMKTSFNLNSRIIFRVHLMRYHKVKEKLSK